MGQSHQVAIIGSGPAGLTAALYAARAQLSPIVLVGNDLGGQISLTYSVENYPGFPEGISGPDLVSRLKKQAERFGAKLLYQTAQAVDFRCRPFLIKTETEDFSAETVIICTGAQPRKLEVPGEAELTGKGVSYCAVCDGPFFKNKEVAVVGGGNSALDEGHYLTRFASRVRLIHRRDAFRADQIYVDRAKKNPKIEVVWNARVTKILGKERVEGVRLENLRTGKKIEMKTDGVFIYIGQIPNTAIFQGQVEMGKNGYIMVDENWQSSVPGVFAAGESEDWRWKQIVTACGDAGKAALAAQRFLTEEGK